MSPTDLKNFSILADLGDEDLELLADLLEEVPLMSGQQLFREEQASEGLLLLASGALRCQSEEGGALGRLEPGAVIGLGALVLPGPRAMTCVADEAALLFLLSPSAFHRFAEDAPRPALRLLEAVTRELATLLREGAARLR